LDPAGAGDCGAGGEDTRRGSDCAKTPHEKRKKPKKPNAPKTRKRDSMAPPGEVKLFSVACPMLPDKTISSPTRMAFEDASLAFSEFSPKNSGCSFPMFKCSETDRTIRNRPVLSSVYLLGSNS